MTLEQTDGRGAGPGVGDTGIGVIQLLPLAEVVPGSNIVVARSIGEYTLLPHVPKGYSLHPSFSDHEVSLMDSKPDALITPSGQKILLRNRYFFEVDWTLNSLLSARILAGLKTADGTFSILDIGGGYESACAIQIGTTTEDLQVSNVDIFLQNSVTAAHEEAASKVKPVLADVKHLPFEDGSQDLVYSSRSLMYFHGSEILRTFNEIVRVLKPGGQAIYYDLPREIYDQQDFRRQLEERLGVSINIADSNLAPGIVVVFHKPEAKVEEGQEAVISLEIPKE